MFYPKGIKKKNSSFQFNGLFECKSIMFLLDDGSWTGTGILIHSNSLTKSDIVILSNMLNKKF